MTEITAPTTEMWGQATIHYPETDGEPMGETDFHINVILYLRQALRYFFRQADQIYVAANMFFYYEEGNPHARRAPDVFVVKGVSKHDRRIYRLWEERVAPCTVFEITSKSTRLEDLGTKRALYEILGVQEYFLFDPLNEYVSTQLQGFRLVEGYYQQPLPLSEDGSLLSEELGLILKPEQSLLRVLDAETGETVPTLDESVAQTEAAVEQARAAVQQAETEAQRAEVEAQRAETEAQRAETEAQRAETEAQRAETEAQRAETAEARATRLEAELERLRRQLGQDSQAD